MSRHLLWMIAALVIGVTALLSSTPAMAHAGHAMAVEADVECASSIVEPAGTEAVQTAAIADADDTPTPCPCCPMAGQGCCAMTMGLASAVGSEFRSAASTFAVGRDGPLVYANAFYLPYEPPAFA